MGRIVGIDFGLKRVGIAVTDPLKIIANGLTTIDNKDIMNFLLKYSEKEQIEAFVIGYPLNLNGTPTDVTSDVDKFISQLKKRFPQMPVFTEDERYSSKMAVQAMIDGGIKKMKRRDKSLIDKISATLILQSYLENPEK